jgi:hypothetical protein
MAICFDMWRWVGKTNKLSKENIIYYACFAVVLPHPSQQHIVSPLHILVGPVHPFALQVAPHESFVSAQPNAGKQLQPVQEQYQSSTHVPLPVQPLSLHTSVQNIGAANPQPSS